MGKFGFGKVVASAAAICAVASSFAASVTIDSVVQRWPWNNKVDITYTVSGAQDRANGVYCALRFALTADGKTYEFSGCSIGASAESGSGSRQHTVTWTAPKGIKATDCTMTATLFTTNVPSGNDYMIVNLTSGDVYYEGLMATQADSNARYNTNLYKSDLMVFRKVPKWADRASLPNASVLTGAGYPTGDADFTSSTTPKNDGVNSPATWDTEDDYYIGVFPVTYCQSRKVDGGSPTTDVYPRDYTTWTYVRGSIRPTDAIPSDGTGTSFLAKFNALTKSKCGVSGFDLPTEPMFEIASRAGATTTYFWGDTLDTDYIVCSANSSNKRDYPDSRKPNAWGLYGMIGGCVWQWCRDIFTGKELRSEYQDALTPKGTDAYNKERYYARRGGGAFNNNASDMAKSGKGRYFFASFRTSARDYSVTDTTSGNIFGFRLAYVAKWGE